MGGPMARRILDAGWPLAIYDVRQEALEAFNSSAAVVCASPREVGARSQFVCICVVDDAQLESVVLGDGVLAGLAAGGIIAVHSTVHPDTCRRLASAATERGVTLIDAAVSGGGDGAAAGTLSVMVGAEEATFERARPVFEAFGRTVRLLGPLGSGATAKLINNGLFAANLKVVEEAVDMGDAMGLDRQALVDVIASGSGGSFALRRNVEGLSAGPAILREGSHLLQKDVHLLFEVVQSAGHADGHFQSVIADLAASNHR
jgi:3-hydroxyisobutyrate dehydrogenase-like beta-hydroxyacid dehydrogenase